MTSVLQLPLGKERNKEIHQVDWAINSTGASEEIEACLLCNDGTNISDIDYNGNIYCAMLENLLAGNVPIFISVFHILHYETAQHEKD